MILSEKIKKAISAFTELPGIGPRHATRLVFFLVSSPGKLKNLLAGLSSLLDVKICPRCFFTVENSDSLCRFCTDPSRDHKTIAIVEKETDLISLERTTKFKGRYLILGDLKKNGVLEDEQTRRLASLKNFILEELGGQAEEIILAINPTTFGDFSASFLEKDLKRFAKLFTRLARGIPSGGEIEFADEETLSSALEHRN